MTCDIFELIKYQKGMKLTLYKLTIADSSLSPMISFMWDSLSSVRRYEAGVISLLLCYECLEECDVAILESSDLLMDENPLALPLATGAGVLCLVKS